MKSENFEHAVVTEITIDDLEFNLEKHKECDYAENIYEFLFNFEKGLNPGFISIGKSRVDLSPKRKTKSHSLSKKPSVNTVNLSEIRSTVCLKLPTKRKNMINSMHFGLITLSPERTNGIMGSSNKLGIKSSKNLLNFNKTQKLSPYLSLSPRSKNVIIRSPRTQVKICIKK